MGEVGNLFRVIIIGAGPAGLLTAQALKKHGIQSTVFERDASQTTRPRDWNFGIYWAQVPLGACLPEELSRQIESVQVDSRIPSAEDVMPLYNGQSGELMKAIPVPYNIRLHRRKFLKLISTGIDIKYGKRLARIESDGQKATAYFEDGSQEVGNLIVGAEGARSKVREFLLGLEKATLQTLPLVSTGMIAKLPAETALKWKELHPRYTIAFHPLGEFLWIGVHDGWDDLKPGEWTFMILHSWTSDRDCAELQGAKTLEETKERIKQYGEPFQGIMQSIPDDTQCWHSRLSCWVTEPWSNHNGTVTLVGDAGHPMTFHRGQGLNNAIHDAASLAKALQAEGVGTQAAVAAAVSTYEEEMCARGKEAVNSSLHNSMAIHNWSTLLKSPLFTAGLVQNATQDSTKKSE